MHDPNCLFCKIIEGEVPSTKVYENESVYAFDDISPMMPTHTLVIPKNHYDNIADDIPADELGRLMQGAVDVARLKGLVGDGFRIIVNTNDDACQTVHHVHVHVLGGEKMNDGNPRVS